MDKFFEQEGCQFAEKSDHFIRWINFGLADGILEVLDLQVLLETIRSVFFAFEKYTKVSYTITFLKNEIENST